MTKQGENYEELDQYDYSDGEYLEKIADKYTEPIGLFLLNFSILEQGLNIAVADFISDRAHEMGFVVIKN